MESKYLLMLTNLNIFSNNDVLFYGMFVGVACHLGFSLLSSIWQSESVHASNYVDTGVQTVSTGDTVIITEIIPMYSESSKIDSLANSPILNTTTWAADYADRAEAIADMLGAFM